MDATHIAAVRKLERAAAALQECAYVGADFYANGGHAARPGVSKHFTAGNQARYGWAPLSPSYAARKAAGLVHSAGGYHYLAPKERKFVELARAIHERARDEGFGSHKLLRKAKSAQAAVDRKHIDQAIARYTQGRQGSKLDRTQTAKVNSLIFGASSVQAGPNLPMLVLTGATKQAVTTVKHQITREGDVAWIIFDNLPPYAIHLHTGTDKMPKRSPVEPNAADAEEVRAAMQRYLDAQLGTGGNVAVSGSTIPGQARVG